MGEKAHFMSRHKPNTTPPLAFIFCKEERMDGVNILHVSFNRNGTTRHSLLACHLVDVLMCVNSPKERCRFTDPQCQKDDDAFFGLRGRSRDCLASLPPSHLLSHINPISHSLQKMDERARVSLIAEVIDRSQ